MFKKAECRSFFALKHYHTAFHSAVRQQMKLVIVHCK